MTDTRETFSPENHIKREGTESTEISLETLKTAVRTSQDSPLNLEIDNENISQARDYLIEHQSIINRIRESNAITVEYNELFNSLTTPSVPNFENLTPQEKRKHRISAEEQLTDDKKLTIYKERVRKFYLESIKLIKKMHALILKKQKLKLKYQYAKYKELQQQLKTEKSSYTRALREYRSADEGEKASKETALRVSLTTYLNTEFEVKLQARKIQATRNNIRLYNSRTLEQLGKVPANDNDTPTMNHEIYVNTKMAYLTAETGNRSAKLTAWKAARTQYLQTRTEKLNEYTENEDSVTLYNARKFELQSLSRLRDKLSSVSNMTLNEEVDNIKDDARSNYEPLLSNYSLLDDTEKDEAQTLQVVAQAIANSSSREETTVTNPTNLREDENDPRITSGLDLKGHINIFGTFEFVETDQEQPSRLATRELKGDNLVNNTSTPSLRAGQKILFDFIHPPTSIPVTINDGDDSAEEHLYMRIRSIDGANVSRQGLYVSTRYLKQTEYQLNQGELETRTQAQAREQQAQEQREQERQEQLEQQEQTENATWFKDVTLENAGNLNASALERVAIRKSGGLYELNKDIVTDRENQQKVQAWLTLFNTWHGSNWTNTQIMIKAKEKLRFSTRHEKVHYALAKLGVDERDQSKLQALGINETATTLTENEITIGNLKINLNRINVSVNPVITTGNDNTRITNNEILITWDTDGLDNRTIHYKLVNGSWEVGEHNDDYSSNPVAELTTTATATP